jgi:transcription-repair coupling factor (superfamily II helicase)
LSRQRSGDRQVSREELLERVVASRPFSALARARRPGSEGDVVLGGVPGSLLSVVAAGLAADPGPTLLIVLPGAAEAEGIARDLEFLGVGEAAVHVPGGEAGMAERSRIVARLASGPPLRVLVAPVRSVTDPVPSPERLRRSRLELACGDELDRDDLVQRLLDAGFERQAVVEGAGGFSVRGDVVDLFAHDQELPLRVEFSDQQIEGLRYFEPATQLSVKVVASAGATLLVPGEEETARGCLADHLPADTVVISRDQARLEEARERHLARYDGADRKRREELGRRLGRFFQVLASSLRLPGGEAINFGGQIIAADGPAFEQAAATLERITRGKKLSLIAFDSPAEQSRFFELLGEQDAESPAAKVLGRRLLAVPGRLHEGFHAPLLAIAATNHHELFAVAAKRLPRSEEPAVRSEAIESFLDLAEGDYVVHLAHGIARFEGLEREKKGGSRQDFLILSFRDGIRLMVPATKIDLVQKYIGGRGEAPELTRFGGKSWSRKKKAVADAVSDLAVELLELQAIRARKSGIRHPPDTPWQQEFEAAFPYTLTPDQGRAVEDIKRDLESPQPMDRLVCGDVGYGKTEVAMRAAFKCVMGGRQVAMLVPTTILAQQHINSFRERMAEYPVTIDGLYRFRTATEQKRALEGLACGAVDVIIGTHRLLQDDVVIKNLGLLIIDEEQRFGVAHKERLKRARKNVDVLVMSATPIPRTLHQALLGIRDISSLTQAPRGRQSIASEVVHYDDALVRRAILRELDREGQVFFVHNRVQTLPRTAARLRELVPEARFAEGHGQMPERALESTMLAFLQKEADVLVATTIIESGLDIPSVNTIFVDQANHYGLSELHQLRGRVGRYHHKAYAYFIVGRDGVVSDVAEKRLRAIEEFSRLGAGFQIAMRDMEIRGAGNILGAEQSGHIASVGYELYCRLLDMAVKRLREEKVVMPEEVEMNLDFTAFLPEDYVAERRLRIEIYRKLGRCVDAEDFRAVIDEMRDRFGPPPPVAQEFVLLARIRALMERLEIQRLGIMAGEGPALRPRRMRSFLDRLRLPAERVRILEGKTVVFVHREPFEGPGELLAFLEEALGEGAGSR